MHRVVVAAVAIGIMTFVSGCSAATHPAAGRPDATTIAGTCQGMPGRLLFIAGSDAFDAPLYQTSTCTWRPKRLTSLGRFSSVSAAAGVIVVANASDSVDHVARVEGNRLAPLATGDSPGGSTPVVAADGEIAYVSIDNDAARPFAVHRVTASGHDLITYRSVNPLTPLAFNPTGGLVIAEAPNKPGSLDPSGRTFLTVVGGGATHTKLDLPLSAVLGMAVSTTTGRIAVSGSDTEEGVIIEPARGRIARRLGAGWRVDAFSPDGLLLLLHKGASLAVLDTRTTGSEPRILHAVEEGSVYAAAWTT